MAFRAAFCHHSSTIYWRFPNSVMGEGSSSWDFSQLSASSPLHLNTQLSCENPAALGTCSIKPSTESCHAADWRAGTSLQEKSPSVWGTGHNQLSLLMGFAPPEKTEIAFQSLEKQCTHERMCRKSCSDSRKEHRESAEILKDPRAFYRLGSVKCWPNKVWAVFHFSAVNYTLINIYREFFMVISAFFH